MTFVGYEDGFVNGNVVGNLNVPAGVVEGDRLIVTAHSRSFPVDATKVPAGWTVLESIALTNTFFATIYTKIAGPSEPDYYQFWFTSSTDAALLCAAWRDVGAIEASDITGTGNSLTSYDAPSVAATIGATIIRVHATNDYGSPPSTPSGHTSRATFGPLGGLDVAVRISDKEQPATGPTGVATATTAAPDAWIAATVSLAAPNLPPNAPTLTTMADGGVIDRAATNRASHVFSDPNEDSQSAFDHRYRVIGAATWTEAYAATPNQFVDYPGGTFAAGDYERQVRTYDAQGVVGPWSASGFFTAADTPPTPTITAPVNAATVPATVEVAWSAPNQDAYQVQVLDGGLVEFDTGMVTAAGTRSQVVEFSDNNVARTIRVRVKLNGLWSDWYAIAVTVAYTPPPVPVVTLTPSGYALVVQVTNPAPVGGEPVVTHNRLYVDDDLAEGETLRVAALPANGTWTYRLPRGGVDYDGLVRVVAVGDNGTTRSSA